MSTATTFPDLAGNIQQSSSNVFANAGSRAWEWAKENKWSLALDAALIAGAVVCPPLGGAGLLTRLGARVGIAVGEGMLERGVMRAGMRMFGRETGAALGRGLSTTLRVGQSATKALWGAVASNKGALAMDALMLAGGTVFPPLAGIGMTRIGARVGVMAIGKALSSRTVSRLGIRMLGQGGMRKFGRGIGAALTWAPAFANSLVSGVGRLATGLARGISAIADTAGSTMSKGSEMGAIMAGASTGDTNNAKTHQSPAEADLTNPAQQAEAPPLPGVALQQQMSRPPQSPAVPQQTREKTPAMTPEMA